MNRKEILVKTLRHEAVDQVPWVPFAGVHAGLLKKLYGEGGSAGWGKAVPVIDGSESAV